LRFALRLNPPEALVCVQGELRGMSGMKVDLFANGARRHRSVHPWRVWLHSLYVGAVLFLGLCAATVSTAAADGVKTFRIEQQPLSSALNEFATQCDRQILFSADIVRSKKARALKGDMEPEAALRLLLKGTGLTFRVTADKTILIEVAAGGDTADVPVPSEPVRFAQTGGTPTAASRNADKSPTEEASSLEPVGEVTVTGSRIVQRDYTANTPITTMSSAAIESTGAVTLEGALAELPQFGVGSGATTTGFFASGQASLNLRGLGPARNLVLIDGRRMQPSSTDQSVDINTIPRAVIDNVEIITGGASAVYGSDAVAGVVNFKTKKDFEGVQLDAQYSPTQDHGGAPVDFALTGGGNFAEGRGNAFVSLGYTKRGTIPFSDVPFYRNFPGYTEFHSGQGVYEPSGNPPSQAAIDGLFSSYGVTPPPNSSRLSFNTDGTLFAADNGLANFKGGGGMRPTQAGDALAYALIYSTVQTPIERYTVFARSTYDITPHVQAYVQAQFVNYTSDTIAESGNTELSIPVTNPFIPASLASLLATRADPTAPLVLDKRFDEAGPRDFNREFNLFQIEAGLSGPIDFLNGTWDIYGARGKTDETEKVSGSVVGSAVDTLLNAPDGGNSICSGGYNPFGLTKLSPQCLSYLTRVPLQATKLTQDVVEATVQGHIVDLPAGDMRFAMGLDYRANGYTYSPDSDIALGTIVGVPSAGASAGNSNVREAYVELLVPVLADLPLVKKLDLDTAYRRSSYNLAGGVNAYKADFNWTVAAPLRFRGGYERAVRAPNVGELFLAPSSDFAGIGIPTAGGGDPCNYNSAARQGANAAQVRALCVAQGIPAGLIDTYYSGNTDVPSTDVGNVKLSPETADTYTLGTVFTSPASHPLLSRMQLSVDYYNISISNVIGVLAGGQALNKCFNLDGSNPTYSLTNQYCALLSRSPADGQVTSVLQETQNLGAIKTRGVDLQFDWRVGLGAVGLRDSDGDLVLNAVVSRLLSYKVQDQPGGPFSDFTNTVGSPTAGGFGSLPRWKQVTTASYVRANWSAGLRWHYLGAMRSLDTVSDPTSTTPPTSSYSLVDLFGSWKIDEHIAVHGGINNLLNRDPPVVDGAAGNTEPSTYDVLGRAFFVAVRANF
jgi:iron complex outermembrane receptor protein